MRSQYIASVKKLRKTYLFAGFALSYIKVAISLFFRHDAETKCSHVFEKKLFR